jgi:dolichol-phosphate mannosyltransferase
MYLCNLYKEEKMVGCNSVHMSASLSEQTNNQLDCSVVVSVYNEQEGIENFYLTLVAVLNTMSINYEIIMVDDGSSDQTFTILNVLAKDYKSMKIITFSKNFGHEAAMVAGIDYALGKVVICMDSDLQHPPDMIPKMLQKYREGYQIINMVRSKRANESWRQQFFSGLFYKLLNKMSKIKIAENASDFFLISHRVASILRTDYRERTRFLRGIIQIVGFSKTILEYEAPQRLAGKSKYSFFKLLKLFFTAISSFSKIPLLLGIITGLIFIFISVILLLYSLIMWILERPLSGYTLIIFFLCAFTGIQLFIIGILGQYIGNLFDEIKGRPIYVIEKMENFNSSDNDIKE